jgi:hypothetical protein
MNALEAAVVELGLASDIVRLPAAQAFVVTAGPDHVRAIANLPSVGAIRPNRTHRVPAR